MLRKIVFQQNLVDEASVAFPVVFWQRFGKSDVHLEVREVFFNLLELIHVEQFAATSSAVPIRNLCGRSFAL